MKIFDQITGWLIVGLGLVHCCVTTVFFKHFSINALWFFGSGLALVVVGALNLLRIQYAAEAPGARIVCVAANVAIFFFTLAIGAAIPLRQNPQAALGIVLATLALGFSVFRRGRSVAVKA